MAKAKLEDSQVRFAANILADVKTRQSFSNVAIADKAGLSEKIVREVLKGRNSVRETVVRVCSAVGIDLDQELREAGLADQGSALAAARFGGYSREIYGHMIGTYTTVRAAYTPENQIKCYHTKIEWDAGISALSFVEAERLDAYGQSGHIYIPPASGFMYLMTINRGWIRTVLISQLVDGVMIEGSLSMRGLILSQYVISGANYAPVATPIVYLKERSDTPVIPYGEIHPQNRNYERCRALLRETILKSYVKLIDPLTLTQVAEA